MHHYVPGQPFYIRELVYRRVKDLMVAKGVRINDFGIVSRANRYYDGDTIDSKEVTRSSNGVEAMSTQATNMPVTDENKPITRTVSPNHSHIEQMLLWVVVCSTLGIMSYVVLDQWTTVALSRRILHKYIYKTKAE